MNEKVLVTGGAGFIGSHLVDSLMCKGLVVHVLDNLSRGVIKNIEHWLKNSNLVFIKKDLLNDFGKDFIGNRYDVIFHLAANPEVKTSSTNPEIIFQQNVLTTYNLLEYVRKTDCTSTIVYTSSSTVYGDANKIPTPEDYTQLKPISIYGSSKLACEAIISGYAYTYGLRAVIFRLANIVGPRNNHGVVNDFIQKLRKNPNELEILGDGEQTKSYLYVSDCIDAILCGLENSKENVEIFNVGSEDQVSVKRIAEIVIEEMGLKNVKLKFTGGVDGGRGWKGDVKYMLLDITKLKSTGWKPKYNSEEAVRLAARALKSQ